MNYQEVRAKLPSLPPAATQPKIEVTPRAFIVWDIMKPWGITSVAFLRSDDGEFTIWTPGQSDGWVWRGPVPMSKKSAELLATWLAQGNVGEIVQGYAESEPNTEVSHETIWIWDPDPETERGFGARGLADGGFELSLMMMGLRRGGAHMKREDSHYLASWLLSVKS